MEDLTEAYRLMAEHVHRESAETSPSDKGSAVLTLTEMTSYGIAVDLHDRVAALEGDGEGKVSLGQWVEYAKGVHEEREHDHIEQGGA